MAASCSGPAEQTLLDVVGQAKSGQPRFGGGLAGPDVTSGVVCKEVGILGGVRESEQDGARLADEKITDAMTR